MRAHVTGLQPGGLPRGFPPLGQTARTHVALGEHQPRIGAFRVVRHRGFRDPDGSGQVAARLRDFSVGGQDVDPLRRCQKRFRNFFQSPLQVLVAEAILGGPKFVVRRDPKEVSLRQPFAC